MTVVKGNGNKRLVVFSADGTVDNPDNSDVALVDANGNFGTAVSVNSPSPDIVVDVLDGVEWYTTVTGLASGVTYTVKVFEFNNDGSTPQNAYKTADGLNNPRSFTTLVEVNPPTALLANNVTATTADLSWTAASPAPDGYIFSLWVDSQGQGFGNASYDATTESVVQPYDELDVSSLTTFDLTDLQGPSDYKYQLYSYIGNSNSTVAELEFFTPEDITSPTVDNITFSGGSGTDFTINELDNGEDFTFVVTFNEKMKTWLTPTFTFENPTPLDLSYVTGSWDDDGMVFTATVNFAGTTPQESLLVDVAVSNAEDLAGNPLDFAFDTKADLFNIDNTDGVLSDFTYSSSYCRSGANLDVITFTISVDENGYGAAGLNKDNFSIAAVLQSALGDFVFDESGAAQSGEGTYTFEYTLEGTEVEGAYNIDITFTDNAGNQTHVVEKGGLGDPGVFNIENTPPTIDNLAFTNTCLKAGEDVGFSFDVVEEGCGTFDATNIAISGLPTGNGVLSAPTITGNAPGPYHVAYTYTIGNTTPESAGDVIIDVTDDAGNTVNSTNTGAFNVDNTVPTIGNTALSSTCVKDGTLLTLTFDVTDLIEGECGAIEASDIVVTNVSGAGSLSQAFAYQGVTGPVNDVLSFTYTLTVSETAGDDENYVVNITATDKAGNASVTNTVESFNVDNTKPVISAVSMNTTCENGGNTVTLTFTATEGGCGTFDKDDITITDDVTTATDTWTWVSGAGTGVYTYTLPLVSGDPSGLVTVSVNATDDAGNAATEATTTFTIDNTAPVISALTVTSATCLNDGFAKLTFTFNVVEEGCGTFSSADLTVDAGLFAAPTPISQTGLGTAASPYIFTYSNTISNANGDFDGAYDITVNATDDAGNVATELQSVGAFNVDNTAPIISNIIITPTCYKTGQEISITFDVTEGGCGTFDENDIEFTADDALPGPLSLITFTVTEDNDSPLGDVHSFTAKYTVQGSDAEGYYTYDITATDDAGNVDTDSDDAFAIDNTGPVLSALTVTPDHAGGTVGTVDITFSVGDDSGECSTFDASTVVYTVTGPAALQSSITTPPVDQGGGVWKSTLAISNLDQTGNYHISLVAADGLGNPSNTLNPTPAVELVIDNTPPYVTGVTATESLLNRADDDGSAATTDFIITVQYNEVLNQAVIPTLEFHLPGKNPTSPAVALLAITQDKPTTSSYSYEFSADKTTNIDMRGIGVSTNGAVDVAGNIQTAAGTKGNLFGIDFVAPQLNSITVNAPSPAVILDDTPQLQLVFDFTETMDNNSDPTVTFETGSAPNNDILGDVLGTPAGDWNLGNVFTASYSVNETYGLEVDNVGVGIANATDLAGNPFPGSFEAGVFDVDTKEPGCGSITMTPAAPQVIVADKDFEVVVVMDQTLDAGVNPTIAFTNSNANYTVSGGAFSQTSVLNDTYSFTVTHDGTQENVTETMSISGFKDTHGNVQTLACTADFDVDTKLPEIVSIAVSESNICGNMEGTEVITITFDEAMDILTVPTLTFDEDLTTNILKSPSTLWNVDSTVFTVTYTIDTVGSYTYTGVDIDVSGAKDALGNTMDLDNTHGIDKINVDSEGPTVTGIAFNPLPSNAFGVNRSNIGLNGFQVVVNYNEAMDGGSTPTITFDDLSQGGTGTVGAALNDSTGSWTSSTEYTRIYTVYNGAVELEIITAGVTGATDVCGNTQESYDSGDDEASFAIDLIAPTCSTLVVGTDPIYEGDKVQEVTVTFSEYMSNSVTPDVYFDFSSNFGAFSGNWDGQNPRVFVGTATHNGNEEGGIVETALLNISTNKPTDLAGNPILVVGCSADFVLDTKKPLVSSVTFTPEDINGTGTLSVAVAFNENMGATVPTLTFSAGSAAFTPAASSWSGNTYTFNYTVADEDVDVDGVTVTINTAKDLAGNVMAPHTSTETFDIDQVSPTIVGLTVSDAMINKAEANTIGYTFTAAATFSEAMNTSANPSIAFAPDVTAGSPSLTLQAGTNPAWSVGNTVATWTYTASDQSVAIEGIDITIAGGEDAFGNATDYTSPTGVFADKFSIDTEDPTVAFGQSTPLAESCVNGTEAIDFSASDGTGFSGIDEVQGRINGGSFAACTTGVQLNALNGWPGTDGPITLELKALDLAGNTTTISRVFTKDATAPVIGGESFTNTCVTTGDVIDIEFTITETGCGAILANNIDISGFPNGNGVLSQLTITGNTPYVVTATYTVGSTDAEGVYNITFNVTDDSGNDATPSVNNAAFTIDKTAPSYSVNTAPTPTCTNKNTNVQLVILSDDNTYGCGPYGASNITASTSLGAAVVASAGGNAYSITVDLSGTTSQDDGIYDIDIVMTDAAGNVNNQTITNAFTLDNTAPAISNVVVTPGCIKGGTTATLTFNVAESGCGISNITISDNVNTNGTWTWFSGTGSGTYTYKLLVDGQDDDGPVDVTVSATDAAGNTTTGVDAGDTDFTIDNTAPVIAISQPLANATVNGTKVVNYTVTETGCGIDVTEFRFNSGTWFTAPATGTALSVYTGFAGLGEGAFTLNFRSTDVAGNVGTSSVSLIKDTQAPTVTTVTPSDNLISIADGGSTFTVAVLFSEGMNTTVNPTVALTANTTVTNSSSTGVWSGGNTFTATFGTINGASAEEIANLDVTVSGAKDDTEDDGNVMTLQTIVDKFSIDTKAPTCSTMTNNNADIYENDKNVTVTVVFSEAMSASPLPTFNITGTSQLTPGATNWTNASTFTQVFTHTGVEETTSANFVVGNLPKDAAGNPAVSVLCSTDVDIDTRKPLVSGVTFTPSLITEATAAFSVAIEFNEAMGATAPTLTFNGGVSSAFSAPSGGWAGNTYTYNYTVTDQNFSLSGLTVDISGAKDVAGNVMVTKTSVQTYAIDQVAPTISAASIKSSNSINDQYAKGGHDILLTFTSSETLNTGAFTGNIAGYSISSISSLGTTYTLSVSTDNTIAAGLVTFSIGFEDVNGNAGAALLTAVTNGSSVTVDKTPPVGTIALAGGQADPTTDGPINFALTFTENVYDLADNDITISGTANATTAVVTGSGATYNVEVTGMTGTGTVEITLSTAKVTDIAGNDNTATTNTDNSVQYNASGATDVSVGAGAEPATLSSLVDNQVEAVMAFDFDVKDDGVTPGTDLLATLITDISISQGLGNDIGDWTTILAGAELSDGTNTITGSVGATTIAFTGLAYGAGQVGNVADDDTKTYTLKVWLSNAPSGSIDNKNLAFKVNRSSFTADGGGSSFKGGAGSGIESGSGNNAIDVDATKLVFTTTPVNTEINTNTTFVVEATDANGNRDVDNGSALTSFLANQSTITSGNTGSLSSGILTLNAVKFSTAFANDYVTAKAAGLADGVSDNFNIREDEPLSVTNLAIISSIDEFDVTYSKPDTSNTLLLAKKIFVPFSYGDEAGMDNETNWPAYNNNFGSAQTPNDNDIFVIYSGRDSAITMTNLQGPYVKYSVIAYSYNGDLNSSIQNFNETETFAKSFTKPKMSNNTIGGKEGIGIGLNNITPQPAAINNLVSVQIGSFEDMPLTLELYDSKGQLMMTLFEGKEFNAGETPFEFNLTNTVSSGQHFLRLTGNGHVVIAPLMIVK